MKFIIELYKNEFHQLVFRRTTEKEFFAMPRTIAIFRCQYRPEVWEQIELEIIYGV